MNVGPKTGSRARWLSRREAAAIAGVHYNTVRLWEQDGRLRTRRVTGPTGEQVQVALDDLEAIASERPPRPRPSVSQADALREIERLREANARLQGEVDALREVIAGVLKLARPGEIPEK